ncbi:hypothetical protein I4U23_005753 [Adineta vaga]|nr:hypothetical protein I4U23_005753 [Adineta vaga]
MFIPSFEKLFSHCESVKLLKGFLLITVCVIILGFSYQLTKTERLGFLTTLAVLNFSDSSLKNDVLPNCVATSRWIYDMHRWTNLKGPYSQGSQDLYLERIFSIIQSTNKYFVEFGFNEPNYSSGGSGANTRLLHEGGWRGLLLDGNNQNEKINLKKYFLFANNIVSIFAENTVPKDLDYISCDMDSHDLWVLRSILQAGYRPRVITTEYNSNYPITDTVTLIDPTIIGDRHILRNFTFRFQECAWGASAGALRMVAEAYGYTMVGRVGYLDLIWVRSDLLLSDCYKLPSFEWYFRDAAIGHLFHRAQRSPEVLSHLVDYKTFVETGGDITTSNQVARQILKIRDLPCFAEIQKFL